MVERYRHPIFALQYDLSEGNDAHLDDLTWYPARLRDRPGWTLELAAGSGRVTRALENAGLRVIALDMGHPMLEILRQKVGLSPDVHAVCADMTQLPFPAPSADRSLFGGALCAYNSLSCILETEALTRCFRQVHDVLAPGSPFCFDIAAHRPEDLPKGVRRIDWTSWTAPDGRTIRRRMTIRHRPETSRQEMRYQYQWTDPDGETGSAEVPFVMNTWAPERFVECARAAGFDLVSQEDRTFVGQRGNERMWVFVELRRP